MCDHESASNHEHDSLEITGAGELDRRAFLRAAGSLGVLSFAVPFVPGLLRRAGADEEDVSKRNVVVLYLRGGMDAMNAIVPYGDPIYYDMRPTIALPPEDSDWGPGVLHLNKYFGLHPAMAPLMPLYEAGKFAPMVCVGSPHNTRSHFDAQDFMEYAAPGMRTIKDGWLNRFLSIRREEIKKGAEAAAELPSDLRALAMQGLLPRSLRGSYPVLAVPDDSVLDQGEVLDLFEEIYGKVEKKGGTDLDEEGGGMMGGASRPDEERDVVATGQVTLESLHRYKQIISEPVTRAADIKYPGGSLSTKLERIAKVIKAGAGLEVACVDVPGWDHHAYEGGVEGTIARMLGDLSGCLAAFMGDLGPMADDTMVMVMTEFGRTCRENGNAGTDHGRGGAMFLLGGKVNGGQVHGAWPGLHPAALIEDRDLPVTTDFRDVFGEVLRHHFAATLPYDFFPGHTSRPLKGLFPG